MTKFTDKDYERAVAEAEEAIEKMVWGVDLSTIELPPVRDRWEGASFEASDDTSRIRAILGKCSPASSPT